MSDVSLLQGEQCSTQASSGTWIREYHRIWAYFREFLSKSRKQAFWGLRVVRTWSEFSSWVPWQSLCLRKASVRLSLCLANHMTVVSTLDRVASSSMTFIRVYCVHIWLHRLISTTLPEWPWVWQLPAIIDVQQKKLWASCAFQEASRCLGSWALCENVRQALSGAGGPVSWTIDQKVFI